MNDIKSAVTDCVLRLYTDDTCFLSTNENASLIEKHINFDFNSLCKWFVDKKLSIHLGEDKIKCILLKKRKKQYSSLSITRYESKIKSNSVMGYTRFILDGNMTGESKTKKALRKWIEKPNFFIATIGTNHTLSQDCYATL